MAAEQTLKRLVAHRTDEYDRSNKHHRDAEKIFRSITFGADGKVEHVYEERFRPLVDGELDIRDYLTLRNGKLEFDFAMWRRNAEEGNQWKLGHEEAHRAHIKAFTFIELPDAPGSKGLDIKIYAV